MSEPYKTYAQTRDEEQNLSLERLAQSFSKKKPVSAGGKIEPGSIVWSLSTKQGPFIVIGPAEVPIGIRVGSKKSLRHKDGGVSLSGWWCRDSRGDDHPYPHYDLTETKPFSRLRNILIGGLSILIVASSCLYLASGYSGFVFSGGIALGGLSTIIGWYCRFLLVLNRVSQIGDASDDDVDPEVTHL